MIQTPMAQHSNLQRNSSALLFKQPKGTQRSLRTGLLSGQRREEARNSGTSWFCLQKDNHKRAPNRLSCMCQLSPVRSVLKLRGQSTGQSATTRQNFEHGKSHHCEDPNVAYARCLREAKPMAYAKVPTRAYAPHQDCLRGQHAVPFLYKPIHLIKKRCSPGLRFPRILHLHTCYMRYLLNPSARLESGTY